MNRLILIKYGELSTKKGNRNFFINTLYNNVKNKLKNYDVKINKDRARMTIAFNDNDLDDIKSIIDKIFGIHTYHIAYVCNSNDDDIKNTLLNIIKDIDFNTFKIETKRSDKNFPIHSQDFNRVLGGLILKNTNNVKVDVHNPNLWIKVEIREKNTYIYFNSYNGCGGYPAGTQQEGMLMLSGGIDSPVAGYMAIKRGVKLEALYFEAPPHTSLEAKNKVIELAKKLSLYNHDIKLHVINFTEIQEAIYKNCPHDYLITIMRRMMYRISEIVARNNNCKILVNGESIGQVASQTLTSMNVINEVVRIPVIRPLACFDKLEIIDIAEKLDTYKISIIPFEDCCTIFVPEHPVINPTFEEARKYEELIDYKEMIYRAIKGHEVIRITNDKNDEFSDLL